MKRVTISDVAKHAGVSKSTVSQFLNKRYDYMALETKDKIEKAIEELKYHPNMMARSLKVKSTKTVGVIVANILHEFTTQIIRAIEDVCQQVDFHIIVCNADDDPMKEEKYITMLYGKQVDGIIIFPTGGNIELYKRLQDYNFPIVFMDRFIPEIGIDSVLLDNEMASAMAIEEFVNRGYQSAGIITTSVIKNVTPRLERISGYKKAIAKYDLPLVPGYIKSVKRACIQPELEKMFHLPKRPEAILAGNDLSLIEILKFAKSNNLSIPGDIAIIGVDDVSFADLFNPPLTTIKQPTFEMGKMAAELLLDKINGVGKDSKEYINRFQPELMRRSSC
ncbi:LacI family DNA-binding transcriptional regulator [Virgibacillus halophilus]|uniref:LacI family DNA-binding transcriptional regulator n=1 Tax=Tigheibacillus halophilus TaxID=361280 RepID=UPI003637C4FC